VLLGVGDGTFQPAQTVSTGNYAKTIALADLNGDGIPDLVTAGGFTGLLSVQFGRGDGTFKATQRYSSSGGDDGFVTLADLNGDGNLDVVLSTGGTMITVYLNSGDGTLQAGVSYNVGNGSDAIAVADWNGDGIPDIAVATGHLRALSITWVGRERSARPRAI
jgi:hypothetical protein